MPDAYYERLSAQDAAFLAYETANTHMHITWTWAFDAAPLRTAEGGVDIDLIRQYVASRLHWIPRYRQRLAYVPMENDPIWVDDHRFNLNYHVRHTSLPQPGDAAQLRQLTGRILSQQLDRRRPLWELWVVEGLGHDRFAIISKTHHCMVDGVATLDLMSVLLSRTPKEMIDEAPRWAPRPLPSARELLRDAAWRRLRTPLAVARGLGVAVGEWRADAEQGLAAVWDTIAAGLSAAPHTPLNGRIGPHRRVAWLTLELETAKTIKNRLGGTVNDVILATVAGAVRRFLLHRHCAVDDLDFRIVVPVSLRTPEERGTLGNRASPWIVALPVGEPDAARRFAAIRKATARQETNKQAAGAELMLQVADWAGSNLMALGVRVMNRLRPYNLILTNIPGAQEPFYLMGARMLEAYPHVPLFHNQGVGIAVSSYLGQLRWGCNADWDLMPDLAEFTAALGAAFEELHTLTATAEPPPARRTRPARGAARRSPAPA
jgi:WS/DGAT/MGAT family acyltransferase